MMVVVFRARRTPAGDGALYKENLDRMAALFTMLQQREAYREVG